MTDTTTSKRTRTHEWLRRSAIVMTLAASALGVVLAAWFTIVMWRRPEGSPRSVSLPVSLLGFGLTHLLIAAKVRDGEIRSPVRLALACVVCAGVIVMVVRTCLQLLQPWQP